MDGTDALLLEGARLLRGASWIGAWLLTYVLHSTVLLLSAWALTSAFRLRWSPGVLQATWKVALLAGWVTSAVQVASPWRPMAGDVRLAAAAAPAFTHVRMSRGGDAAGAGMSRGARFPQEMGRSPSVPGLPGRSGARPARDVALTSESLRLTVVAVPRLAVALLLWGVVAGALLLHLALARRRLLATLDDRRDAGATIAGAALRHLASRAGATRIPTLSTSDALRSPAAISQQEIVLPTRALQELTLAQQEGVLAHELAHVVRGDPRWLRVATWIERVGWFQPLNRVARRELQRQAEFAADAWAVALTREPLALAQALSHVAQWVPRGATSSAGYAPGADGSPLVERVRRLTAPLSVPQGRGGRPAGLALALVMMGVLAVLPRHAGPAPSRTMLVERMEHAEHTEAAARRGIAADGDVAGEAPHDVPQAQGSAPSRSIRIVRLREGTAPPASSADGDSTARREGVMVRRALFISTRAAS